MQNNHCSFFKECRFYNNIIEDMPSISRTLKEDYCLGDYAACARFYVSKEIGRENLPDYVFPHQMDKAKNIVEHFKEYGEINYHGE